MATKLDSTAILEKVFGTLTPEEKARISANTDDADDDVIDSTDEVEDEVEDTDAEDAEQDNENDALESDESETESDDTSDEADEPDEVVQPVKDAAKKPSKNLDKKEQKIVGLKSDNKTLLQQNREMRSELEQLKADKRKSELLAKYGETHDEVQADILARADLNSETIDRRMKVLTFMASNPALLVRYPEAGSDAETILSIAESRKIPYDRVCKMLYEKDEPLEVRRNKASVNGTIKKGDTDFSVTNATKASTTPKTTKLTPEEARNFKAYKEHGWFPANATEEDFKKSLNR